MAKSIMSKPTECRISYMLNGSSSYTGTFYSVSDARTALARFKAWTKAWLQTKQADGSWKTEE